MVDKKLRIKFIVTELQKIKAPIAYGDLYVLQGNLITMQHIARSGGYGKGPIDSGEYDLDWLTTPEEMDRRDDNEAYTLDGFGWAIHIEPRFKTERSSLMIHPDGSIEGSLGCIAIPFDELESNKIWYENLAKGLAEQGKIPLTVEYILDGRKC